MARPWSYADLDRGARTGGEAEAVHGKATVGIQVLDGRFLQEFGRALETGADLSFTGNDAARLREIAVRVEEGAKRQAADREAKARDDLAAECRLVEAELGRLLPGEISSARAEDAGTIALGVPDGAERFTRDGFWWRLLSGAASELRRLRLELRRHRQFIGVEMAGKPKPDPQAIEPDVDALAKRVQGVIEGTISKTMFGPGVSRSTYIARRIAEELCR